jgi:hypothetical protein
VAMLARRSGIPETAKAVTLFSPESPGSQTVSGLEAAGVASIDINDSR